MAMAGRSPAGPLDVPRQLDEARVAWPARATLGEGTCWSVREQALYWVDILGQRLHRFTPASGDQRSWDFDETISAVAERRDRPGLIVSLRRCLALFDPAVQSLQRFDEVEPERPANRFNDGKCDAAGRFWAGTMDFDCKAPTGALYRVDASSGASPIGSCELALDAGFAVTNGPTWSADGRTLYFTDTARGRINAYDFDPLDGRVSNGRPWLRLAPGDGNPDGMTTDAAGRIWIAHWGGACVSSHDPVDGTELMRIGLPTDHITNVAFGGPGLDELYVSSACSGLSPTQLDEQPLAGALFVVRTSAVGRPADLFAG
jgi:D-xylonolactonase